MQNVSKKLLTPILLTAIFSSSAAFAETKNGITPEEVIQITLEETKPDTNIESITETPIEGVYEVVDSGNIYYTNKDATYVLSGALINTDTGTNITQERINEVNKADYSVFKLENAIKTTNGEQTQPHMEIVVFEDPNCPYCKKFTEMIKDIEGLTIYTMLYPILSKDSFDKAENLWCSDNKAKAWRDWMVDGIEPSKADPGCEPTQTINENLAAGQALNVQGTPTIYFADGSRFPGLVSIEEITEKLEKVKEALDNTKPEVITITKENIES